MEAGDQMAPKLAATTSRFLVMIGGGALVGKLRGPARPGPGPGIGGPEAAITHQKLLRTDVLVVGREPGQLGASFFFL